MENQEPSAPHKDTDSNDASSQFIATGDRAAEASCCCPNAAEVAKSANDAATTAPRILSKCITNAFLYEGRRFPIKTTDKVDYSKQKKEINASRGKCLVNWARVRWA